MGAYSHDIMTFSAYTLALQTIYFSMKWMSGSLFLFNVTNEPRRTYYDLYFNCKQYLHDSTMCLRVERCNSRIQQKIKITQKLNTHPSSVGAYGKHMLNTYSFKKNIMTLTSNSWLGLDQITTLLTHKHTLTCSFILAHVTNINFGIE